MCRVRTNEDNNMKTRSGFVSNSSSSSFIVAFPNDNTSNAEELRYMLFGDAHRVDDDTVYGEERCFDTIDIAEIVLEDMYRGSKTLDEVFESFRYYLSDSDKDEIKSMIENNPGSELYVFYYSDDGDPIHRYMERNNVFCRLPNMTINMH